MRNILFGLVLLVASPVWAQEPVGKVVDLVGEVLITHTGAKTVPAAFRQAIYLGDEINTKGDGGIKILFIDDTLLTVKENSKVLISEFLFNPAAKQRKISFEATVGRLRAIVSKFFGKEQVVEIKTPTAVAGIRGTDLGSMIERKKTALYCFECERDAVSANNREFPSQMVGMATGEAIEIIADRAASAEHIQPIPKDILDRIDILFDIQHGEASKVTKSISSELAKEAAAKKKPAAAKAAKREKELVEKGETVKANEQAAHTDTPTTTDQPTEIIPSGTDEATSGTTVTITLPSQ